MKSTQLLMISLALGLNLAGCRDERKNIGNAHQQSKKAEAIPQPPPQPPPLQAGDPPATAVDPENAMKKAPAFKGSGPTVEEQLLKMKELERAEVFDVLISVQATQDRAEAWLKLTSEVPHEILKKKQYVYARDLLDRYRDAPVLERLVFWRLVDLRLNHQGVSGITRIVGDDYQDLRLSMNPILKAMLYSALGEDPEKLPDFLASRKAIEMLNAPAQAKNRPDN